MLLFFLFFAVAGFLLCVILDRFLKKRTRRIQKQETWEERGPHFVNTGPSLLNPAVVEMMARTVRRQTFIINAVFRSRGAGTKVPLGRQKPGYCESCGAGGELFRSAVGPNWAKICEDCLWEEYGVISDKVQCPSCLQFVRRLEKGKIDGIEVCAACAR